MDKLAFRKNQPVHRGLGSHFATPKRKRTQEKKQIAYSSYARRQKLEHLDSKIAGLYQSRKKNEDEEMGAESDPAAEQHPSGVSGENGGAGEQVLIEEIPESIEDEVVIPDDGAAGWIDTDETVVPLPKAPKRLTPDQEAEDLYARWKIAIPTLVQPLLGYLNQTMGKVWQTPSSTTLATNCTSSECARTSHRVTGLLFGSFLTYSVTACACQPLICVLVQHGMFPTAPHSPRWAVSVELLDLFLALTERSSDAVTALAAALNSAYKRRSFIMSTSQGKRVRQPFRKGLGYAMQWYNCLRIEIERMKERVIASHFSSPAPGGNTSAVTSLSAAAAPDNVVPEPIGTASSPAQASAPALTTGATIIPSAPPVPGSAVAEGVGTAKPATHAPVPELLECHRLLQSRCPACFGGNSFGSSFEEGGDFHVATDCNFNHRHIRGVANSPAFYDPEFFLSKQKVDLVGERIEKARPRKKKKEATVPDVAIDSCQESHEAGTGSTVKTSLERFDIGGLAALVCRHDVPLFLANVDTPGEQQKYAVALIEQLMSMIPRNATVVVLYDVGCVLDRSLNNYEIFSQGTAERLLMATSVMHSYVHQWSCQLQYNPRLKKGLGLTDGENVERLWSRLRGLIGVCRVSAANRRILLLDRQLRAVSQDLRDELGNWLRRKMKTGVLSQGAEARKTLKECGEEETFLRAQWQNQKESQMSVRAHAPNRLKKDLDKILQIQTEVQELETTIQKSSTLVKSGGLPAACRSSIQDLQKLCTSIQDKAQQMYAALNVSHEFPSIVGVDLEFVRKLFLLRELKFQVQKRATSAFWEFDKLDRAAGGKEVPHGTKMHQTIRATMSKKTVALNNAVVHYNRDCAKLAKSRPKTCKIPIPKPLPTELKKLKTCPDLMESVWIEPVDSEKQRWVYDASIRDGIRAVHRIDRCTEETRRLGREADNMCRWFGRELRAVADAIRDPRNVDLLPFLQQDYDDLLALVDTWPTPLAPKAQYDAHVQAIDKVSARSLTCLVLPQGETDDVDEVGTADADLDPVHVDDLLIQDYAEEQLNDEQPEEPDTAAAVVAEVIVACSLTAYQSTPDWVVRDETILQDFSFGFMKSSTPPDTTSERSVSDLEGRKVAIVGEDELTILSSATGRLNDDCVNALGPLLRRILCLPTSPYHLQAERCAIFSSFSPFMVREHLSDQQVWRKFASLKFWNRDIWILPIHRVESEHWVLATVLPTHRQILLFDSFGEHRPWKGFIKEISALLERLIKLAIANGCPLPPSASTGPWNAHPVIIEMQCTPVQTNGYDCGVWVVACMAAVLRGRHIPAMTEPDITSFRSILYQFILALPVDVST